MNKINKNLLLVLVLLIFVVLIVASKNSKTSKGNDEKVNAQNKTVSVYLDDALIEFNNNPEIKDNTVYIPIAEYAKVIGAKVKFKTSGKIIIKKDNKNMVINSNDNTVITEDNKSFFMNSLNKGKRTLLPIEPVSIHFGYTPLELTDNSINVYSKEKAEEIKAEELKQSFIEVIDKEKEEPVEENKTLEEDGEKVAYLTFDDGPNEVTPKILDILKENNVEATFFMLGSSMKNHIETTKRISDEGHGLGVHSMTHQFKSVYASPEAFLDEMNGANNILEEASGKRTLFLRAPYGSKPYMKQEFRDLTAQSGYKIWDWNVDSRDSIKQNTLADEVYEQVAMQIEDKERAVLLFHDRAHTLEALPRIIELLKSKGFEIKKIDESITPLNFWNDVR